MPSPRRGLVPDSTGHTAELVMGASILPIGFVCGTRILDSNR